MTNSQLSEICNTQWKGIGWADADTDQTITDVKASNARRAAYCKGLIPVVRHK